jgi:phosphoketolase
VITTTAPIGSSGGDVLHRLVTSPDDEIPVLDAWWRAHCSGAIDQSARDEPDGNRFRVRGFIEEGSEIPFDMALRNHVSCRRLTVDAPNNARRTPPGAWKLRRWRHAEAAGLEPNVVVHSQEMPVRDWTLSRARNAG